VHLADLGWSGVDRDLLQWQNIHTLDLGYNPLNCDCKVAWLREVMVQATNTSRYNL
jgi:hypothetical protein